MEQMRRALPLFGIVQQKCGTHEAGAGRGVPRKPHRAHAQRVRAQGQFRRKGVARLAHGEVHIIAEPLHLIRERRVVSEYPRAVFVQMQSVRTRLRDESVLRVRENKVQGRKRQRRRERIEQEASYVWREIHGLVEEEEALEEEIHLRRERAREEEPEKKRVLDEIRPPKWRIHPVEILLFFLIVAGSFVLIHRPWNFLVAIVLSLCCGIYVWNRMKVGKRQEKTEPEKILEEITPREEKEPLERLLWKREHLEAERKDKEVQYENLKECLEELEEVGQEEKELDRKREAVLLAAEKLNQVSRLQQDKMEDDLDVRVSQIMREITGGKYTRLVVEEPLKMSVLMEDGRKVGIDRLSRGTIEQIYFALRMAAGELLYEEEYPVILDDTFAYYDEARLGNTLKWLAANRRQVLLFTCQKREEEILGELGIPYKRQKI